MIIIIVIIVIIVIIILFIYLLFSPTTAAYCSFLADHRLLKRIGYGAYALCCETPLPLSLKPTYQPQEAVLTAGGPQEASDMAYEPSTFPVYCATQQAVLGRWRVNHKLQQVINARTTIAAICLSCKHQAK